VERKLAERRVGGGKALPQVPRQQQCEVRRPALAPGDQFAVAAGKVPAAERRAAQENGDGT